VFFDSSPAGHYSTGARPTPGPESPADEYEKKLRVQRGDVRQVLDGLLAAFAGLHSTALVAAVIAAFAESSAGLLVASVLWVFSAVVASFPALVTFRNLHCLRWTTIALGVSPWVVIATEATLAVCGIVAAYPLV
jgi:hypothetical protein